MSSFLIKNPTNISYQIWETTLSRSPPGSGFLFLLKKSCDKHQSLLRKSLRGQIRKQFSINLEQTKIYLLEKNQTLLDEVIKGSPQAIPDQIIITELKDEKPGVELIYCDDTDRN